MIFLTKYAHTSEIQVGQDNWVYSWVVADNILKAQEMLLRRGLQEKIEGGQKGIFDIINESAVKHSPGGTLVENTLVKVLTPNPLNNPITLLNADNFAGALFAVLQVKCLYEKTVLNNSHNPTLDFIQFQETMTNSVSSGLVDRMLKMIVTGVSTDEDKKFMHDRITFMITSTPGLNYEAFNEIL